MGAPQARGGQSLAGAVADGHFLVAVPRTGSVLRHWRELVRASDKSSLVWTCRGASGERGDESRHGGIRGAGVGIPFLLCPRLLHADCDSAHQRRLRARGRLPAHYQPPPPASPPPPLSLSPLPLCLSPPQSRA